MNENLSVTYLDSFHGADTLTAELQVPAIVWDGGGADSNWTTPENWSTDTVPTV